MPIIETKGAASSQGFGEFSQPSTANYIEDVFSTYLYIGNGSTQIINNGIDLANMGGMVWLKDRTSANPSWVMDTLRGTASAVQTSSTSAINTSTNIITAYNANGFSIGANNNSNTSGNNIVSWTFRKQPKFFDVVTYTGTGSARTIAHNLGSAPGCIIVKRTDTTGNWQVYHRSVSAYDSIQLNLSDGLAYEATIWNRTAPTSTVFSVGTDATVNASGGTYVAYIFAHNAGGFGLTGADNVISCGSYVGSGVTGNTIALGYEPQWIMIKRTDPTTSWGMFDNMRGFVSNNTSGSTGALWANLSNAESTGLDNPYITSTGFGLAGNNTNYNASGGTYIYIAIRRPMKTPTSGASVFRPITRTGTGAGAQVVTGIDFSPDLALIDTRSNVGGSAIFTDRLRGVQKQLQSASTNPESTPAANGGLFVFGQDGYSIGPNYDGYTNVASRTYIDWMFSRAPCFFDVVCYTGTGVPGVVNHNLSVVPEMIIVKDRSATTNWIVYSASLGATKYLYLNQTSASATATAAWNDTTPTTTNFTIGTSGSTNGTGDNYVAYLFASCPGVSKVGSYTGNGTTQTINCGFSAGARFILIKRTDSTGDWYVWDTARGIVTGNDPRLSLNTTASEVTTDDSVDADATGFIVNQLTATNVNVSGGTYIYLAIA